MIHLPLLLRWPVWRKTPVKGPEIAAAPQNSPDWWASIQPGLRARVIASRVPHCWGCGREGVSFCGPVACLPPTSNNRIETWRPAVPFEVVDLADEAQDARIAAVLDQEAA